MCLRTSSCRNCRRRFGSRTGCPCCGSSTRRYESAPARRCGRLCRVYRCRRSSHGWHLRFHALLLAALARHPMCCALRTTSDLRWSASAECWRRHSAWPASVCRPAPPGCLVAKLAVLGLVVAVLLLGAIAFVPIVGLLIWLVVASVTLLRSRAGREVQPVPSARGSDTRTHLGTERSPSQA